MGYEEIKYEFEKVKREELMYIDKIVRISSNRILSEKEKLDFYRTLNSYEIKLKEILKELKSIFLRDNSLSKDNLEDVIIEFELPKDYLSSLHFQKKYVLENLWIDVKTFSFKLTVYKLMKYRVYMDLSSDVILNYKRLIDKPIYVLCGYYDASEDCYGPLLGELDDYLYGIYENISNNGYYNDKIEISKKEMDAFEEDKVIIYSTKYVFVNEIRKIFKEELLNSNNHTICNCVIQTKNKIEELSYIRSLEYQEKVLLDRINELYKKVKGEFICKDMLYNGKFIQMIRESYRLENGNVVSKEKVIKNNGLDSVIVIAITKEGDYIITVQNRINDKLIFEFPSGYIENGEEIIEAAKRELREETGYVSSNLILLDEAYTSLGIDNSKSYIVLANNCVKVDEKIINKGTEYLTYGLFSREELDYMIDNNIINGAMNKLAYYNLISKDNYIKCR